MNTNNSKSDSNDDESNNESTRLIQYNTGTSEHDEEDWEIGMEEAKSPMSSSRRYIDDDSRYTEQKVDNDSKYINGNNIDFLLGRDSRRSTGESTVARNNAWTLDSTIGSSMISSPRFVSIPNLEERLESKKEEYKCEKMEERKIEKARRKKEERESRRKVSFDQRVEEEEKMKECFHENICTEESISKVADEDEQWERKRREKLSKLVNKSTSYNSLAPSMSSSTSLSSFFSFGSYSPSLELLKELKQEFEEQSNPTSMSIIYGLINSAIVLPIIMSFGSIIYSDAYFRPFLPLLVKLTVISGIVHQLCFCFCSTLPFSIGSVQDAGLIFLSSMASSIVTYCKSRGCDDEQILATTVIGLSIYTTLLGIGLIIIGKLKLATFVQSLPTPVVGGYLAFIGFFCGQNGLAMMAKVHVKSVLEWNKFFQPESFTLLLPGLLGGITIFCLVKKLKHMAVLPSLIIAMILTFYAVLKLNGISLEEARNGGWFNEADPPPVWYKTWIYFQFDKVIWSALPGNVLTLMSMIFVVALSSSLDVAAIDLEVPKPLEYNYELRMIGLSNIISGLSGGYTGSYIFSQTIFSMRAGIRSRLAGFIVASFEFISVILPISILNYIPNCFFGSLLLMICFDLMVEWLWDVRLKQSNLEYFLTLSTFVLIQIFGVEYGIIAGVLLHYLLLKLGYDLGAKDKLEMASGSGSGREESASFVQWEACNSFNKLPNYGGIEKTKPYAKGFYSPNG
eukprot:CAMPEP_0184862336 /NCGR_PEP_ID=MMETSP0580-20130426/6807_1 /TAXON_ID=1118495 /ORGANISM="Dactyliosolen fragilissimus" /LENGTH=736 /DNA_ID=CAMNT_0027360151 /DNA_START=145 /DNA_END=2351 /DNA_ORIENTATION=+